MAAPKKYQNCCFFLVVFVGIDTNAVMMFKFHSQVVSLRCVLAVGLFLIFAGTTRAQSVVYDATVLPANPQTGVISYLQQVTAAGPNGTYSITGMTFGINWSDDSADQGLVLDFYTGLDLSATSTNVLAGATFIDEAGFSLPPPGLGNFTYTLTFGAPIVVPSNVFGIDVHLTDATGAFGTATGINGRFTSNTPVTGSAPGFVWNDANGDGIYTGSEQTKFGMTNAYIRMSITANAPVPEPSTWIMTAGGLGILLLLMRRRLA